MISRETEYLANERLASDCQTTQTPWSKHQLINVLKNGNQNILPKICTYSYN